MIHPLMPADGPSQLAGADLAPGTEMARRRVHLAREVFQGFDFTGWFVLAAPAGTPPEIVARVNRELDAILKDPAVAGRLRDIGFITHGAGTLDEARGYVQAQYEAWGKVVREIGLQPE